MGFWEMLAVASMPVVQVMLIGLVGAFLASRYCAVLTADARKHMNKVCLSTFSFYLTHYHDDDGKDDYDERGYNDNFICVECGYDDAIKLEK